MSAEALYYDITVNVDVLYLIVCDHVIPTPNTELHIQ